jgi:hypothetical protein
VFRHLNNSATIEAGLTPAEVVKENQDGIGLFLGAKVVF